MTGGDRLEDLVEVQVGEVVRLFSLVETLTDPAGAVQDAVERHRRLHAHAGGDLPDDIVAVGVSKTGLWRLRAGRSSDRGALRGVQRVGAHGLVSQYGARSGISQRMPPRGSGTSPAYRGMR